MLYITERCVFRLIEGGLELIEIAPGIDLERDILALMDFRPAISRDLKTMDVRIFRDEAFGMREVMLALPLEQRFTYDEKNNLFFINFEGLGVRSREEIEHLRRVIEARLQPLRHKVYTIVNYDNFSLAPELLDAYMDMVRDLVERYYIRVTRYTSSTFTRALLGNALEQRAVKPLFFTGPDEALGQLIEPDE